MLCNLFFANVFVFQKNLSRLSDQVIHEKCFCIRFFLFLLFFPFFFLLFQRKVLSLRQILQLTIIYLLKQQKAYEEDFYACRCRYGSC